MHLPTVSKSFTSLVASRTFELVRDGVATRLEVEVGLPLQDVESVGTIDWRCPVRLTLNGSTKVEVVCGVDSVQALTLALQLVQISAARLFVALDREAAEFCLGHGDLMLDGFSGYTMSEQGDLEVRLTPVGAPDKVVAVTFAGHWELKAVSLGIKPNPSFQRTASPPLN